MTHVEGTWMRISPGLAALALAGALLTGCGGSTDSASSDTEAYCSDLKADKTYFDSLNDGDVDKFGDAFEKLHALSDKAPSEVADDWATVDKGITSFETALEDAEIKFEDLKQISKGTIPDGVDPQKLQELATKLDGFGGPEFDKAGKAIQKHAKKTCDVDLS